MHGWVHCCVYVMHYGLPSILNLHLLHARMYRWMNESCLLFVSSLLHYISFIFPVSHNVILRYTEYIQLFLSFFPFYIIIIILKNTAHDLSTRFTKYLKRFKKRSSSKVGKKETAAAAL